MALPEWTPGGGSHSKDPQGRHGGAVISLSLVLKRLSWEQGCLESLSGQGTGQSSEPGPWSRGWGDTQPHSAASRRKGSPRARPHPHQPPLQSDEGKERAASRTPNPASGPTWWPRRLTYLCSCVTMLAPPRPPSGSAPCTWPGVLRWPGWLRSLGTWLREAEREQAPGVFPRDLTRGLGKAALPWRCGPDVSL